MRFLVFVLGGRGPSRHVLAAHVLSPLVPARSTIPYVSTTHLIAPNCESVRQYHTSHSTLP
eukprot:1604168-Rhodomonas_salina.1